MATDATADDARPPRWDGRTPFCEDDEPLENIRRIITSRPPDAITGEPFDPDAVPGSSGADVTPPK
jgi:hypothetical protein